MRISWANLLRDQNQGMRAVGIATLQATSIFGTDFDAIRAGYIPGLLIENATVFVGSPQVQHLDQAWMTIYSWYNNQSSQIQCIFRTGNFPQPSPGQPYPQVTVDILLKYRRWYQNFTNGQSDYTPYSASANLANIAASDDALQMTVLVNNRTFGQFAVRLGWRELTPGTLKNASYGLPPKLNLARSFWLTRVTQITPNPGGSAASVRAGWLVAAVLALALRVMQHAAGAV